MSEFTQPLPDFLTDPKLRLILFGGKGGVGKTTSSLASAIHIASARPDKRILVVSTDPAHSLLDGVAGSTLPGNLAALEFNADELHQKFMTEHGSKFKEIAARGTFLDREDIDRFLSLSVPGLDELMAYVQIATWLKDHTYDTIVVDTAPTGHTLRLLAMPQFLEGWLGAMDALLAKHRFMLAAFGKRKQRDQIEEFLETLGRDLREPGKLMTDASVCRFVPVMLAEPMSAAETSDLARALDDLSIPHPELIVNRVMPADHGDVYTDLRNRQMSVLHDLTTILPRSKAWVFPHATAETRGAEILGHLWDRATPVEFIIRQNDANQPEKQASEGRSVMVNGALVLPPPGTRLLMFAGKGGVGKTTMACASAVALSRAMARRTLIVSTDPAHSVADCIGLPVTAVPSPIRENVWAIELNAEREFNTLRDLYRDEIEQLLSAILPGMDLSFDKDVMQRVLDLAPPGLDEVMSLIRVTELLEAGNFDLIVLDTAPTGHLLRLLELPHLIEQWINAVFKVILKFDKILRLPKVTAELIRISRGIKKLRAMFGDETRCRLHAVTIPTEMALAETGDLITSAQRIGIHLGQLIINQVAPAGRTEFERTLFESDARMVDVFTARFTALNPVVVYRSTDPRGAPALLALGTALYDPLTRAKAA